MESFHPLFNFSGHPAASIPVGKIEVVVIISLPSKFHLYISIINVKGLPVGMQIVGRMEPTAVVGPYFNTERVLQVCVCEFVCLNSSFS